LPVTNHLCGAGTAPHIIYADSADCCAFATLIDKSRSGRSNSARFVDSGKNNVGKSAPLQAGYMTRQQNREIVQACIDARRSKTRLRELRVCKRQA
jgi:hypothetical protein